MPSEAIQCSGPLCCLQLLTQNSSKMLKSKLSDEMERVTKTEEKVKKFREKKKILREKKRLKLKERKFQEKKEQQPKRIINNHFMGKKERKKLKKKIVKKLVKSDDGNTTTKVVKLSDLEKLEGRILGCVKEIVDWGLILELPNFLGAAVHITEISDVYSELMEKYSSGQIEKIPELSALFSVGDLVVAKITECNINEKGQKQMRASLKPHLVNDVYLNSSLQVGLVLPACVHSKEDHGYLLDVGVQNTRVFIKYSNVNRPLILGQIVTCLITNMKQAASMCILEVSLDEELIAETRLSPSQVSLLNLIPGMKVLANITQELPHGWRAKLRNTQFKAFLSWEQMSDVHNSKYLTNKHVDLDCTVLYVSPQFHVYLSCNSSLLERRSCKPEYEVGHFVQNGESARVETQGIFFQCDEDNGNIRGFISQYQGGCKPELFQAKFQQGEVIKECRIIEYRRLDDVYIASLSRKVLSAISSIAEVNLGDLIPCTVEATTQRGVIAHTGYYKLKVTCENEYIQGNKDHLKQGDAIQARVIRIDHEQNSLEVAFKTIYLHAQPLISVKNTRPGKLVWGIMREKLTSGVRVEFENDISGVLHTRAMGKESMRLYYKRFVPDTGIVCQIERYEDGELTLSEAVEHKEEADTL